MRRERQPDFGQFFHLAAWRPLDYETRPGPNLLHELAYLSSYSHDARFRPDRMRYERKRLVIELERDCWEILQATGKLPSVRSELSVRGVSSLTVTLTERWVTGGLGTHCQALASIDDVRVSIGRQFGDPQGGEVVIDCGSAGLVLTARAEEQLPLVRIRDLSKPY